MKYNDDFSTMSDIGDTLEDVGQVSSSISLVITYILASLFIILGLVIFIVSFSDKKDDDLDEKDKNITSDNFNRIFGIVLIVLSIIAILVARWWNNLTHTNRTAAQIGGTSTTVSFLKNIFRR